MTDNQLKHFVGGEWVEGTDHIVSINPSDLSDVLGYAPQDSGAAIDAAVSAARSAQPEWAALSPEVRSDALDRVGTLLFERRDALGELLAREEGKTRPEGLGETVRAARIFKYFAGEALRLHGQFLPSTRPGIEASTRREAVGTVGLIAPWNFPIAIPAWKAAPAMAFGNAVVLKPSEITPFMADALARVIEEAGIPKGVFNLVHGAGAAGGALVEHDGVDAISFTGSRAVGAKIAQTAAARQRSVQLELGGKNPIVILDDADLEIAVACALDGGFFSTGQRCTASSRIIATAGIHDALVEALAERVGKLRVGNALDADTQIGPVASQDQFDKIKAYEAVASADGAELICEAGHGETADRGYFVAPRLYAGLGQDMRIYREEIFGPVAGIQKVDDFDAALAAANNTEFGLSAGIVTGSLKYASAFQSGVRAGMVMVNLPTAGVDYHVPFGGQKASSFGPKEQAFAAQEFYTRSKTSYVRAA